MRMLSSSRWVGLWTALVLCIMWRQAVAEVFRRTRNGQSADNEIGSSGQIEAVLDRLISLERSVGELKEQLSHIVKHSSNDRVFKVLQDLQGVCEELSASKPSPESHGPSSPAPGASGVTDSALGQPHTCPQHAASRDFLVTAVMKTETDTDYIVTVCYVGPEKPKVSQQLKLNGKMEPLKPLRQEDVSLVTTRRNKTDAGNPAYLGIDFDLQTSQVRLSLRLDEDSPDVVQFPRIQQKVVPEGNEIVYDVGSDLDIEIYITNEANETIVEGIHNMTSLYLKSNTQVNTVDFFRMLPGLELSDEISDIEFTEQRRSGRNAAQLLHIPYSPERPRGLLVSQMMVFMNCSGGCLVGWMAMSHLTTFRPSIYSKLFPDNFVGFVKYKRPPGFPGPSDETEEVQCYEENELTNCLLDCRAIGDDPTVTLARADPLAPTSAHTDVRDDDSPYFASQFWDFDSPVQQDAGLYTCTGVSRDGRHVISYPVMLKVDRVAKILRDLTNVTVDNETLTAVCTADGIPAPTVRFGPYYYSEPTDVINQADVTLTPLNNTTIQATFFLRDLRKYEREDLDNIYCFAENVEHTNDHQHIDVIDKM